MKSRDGVSAGGNGVRGYTHRFLGVFWGISTYDWCNQLILNDKTKNIIPIYPHLYPPTFPHAFPVLSRQSSLQAFTDKGFSGFLSHPPKFTQSPNYDNGKAKVGGLQNMTLEMLGDCGFSIFYLFLYLSICF